MAATEERVLQPRPEPLLTLAPSAGMGTSVASRNPLGFLPSPEYHFSPTCASDWPSLGHVLTPELQKIPRRQLPQLWSSYSQGGKGSHIMGNFPPPQKKRQMSPHSCSCHNNWVKHSIREKRDQDLAFGPQEATLRVVSYSLLPHGAWQGVNTQ